MIRQDPLTQPRFEDSSEELTRLKDYREDYREDELTADHDGQYSDLNDFPDDSLATVGYDSDATKDFSSQA